MDLLQNLLYLKTFIRLYKLKRETYCPFKIENQDIKRNLACLKLNFMINQLRQRKGLFGHGDFRRNAIDNYLEKRWKYELYYEVKILHLMEKEYQIANQMIYQLDSKIHNYDQEEVTVGELIEQT